MQHYLPLALLYGALLLLAACTSASPEVVDTPLPSNIAATETPTQTPLPSPTPTSEFERVILWTPQGSDPSLAASLEATLDRLALQDGLRMEITSELGSADLSDDVRLVVALPPNAGIAQMAQTHPQIQFLTLGVPDIEAGGNLSTIGVSSSRADQIAFVAGYLAAAVTPDWRAGVLSEPETPGGKAARNGFTNGLVYFCGLCRPVYPPFPLTGYPIAEPMSAGGSPTDWQAAIANLQTWQVNTVFVDPGIATEELYRELANAGMNIIANELPPEGLSDQWIAAIHSGDPIEAIIEMWADLISGRGGLVVQMPLTVEAVNPELFSPGRQEMVNEMLKEFSEGYISTGVDPETGDPEF